MRQVILELLRNRMNTKLIAARVCTKTAEVMRTFELIQVEQKQQHFLQQSLAVNACDPYT